MGKIYIRNDYSRRAPGSTPKTIGTKKENISDVPTSIEQIAQPIQSQETDPIKDILLHKVNAWIKRSNILTKQHRTQTVPS